MNIKLRHVLFYLLIVSAIAMGVSFSRFSATLTNSGAENTTPPDIEFSTWVMDYRALPVSLTDMAPGAGKTIDIWVRNWKENGGDVKRISSYNQSFNLELETTGNLPLAFTLKEKTGEDIEETVAFSRVDSYHYLSASRTFEANKEGKREFTLTVTWPEGIKGEQYRHEIDYLVLGIKAVQSQGEQSQEEQSQPGNPIG